MRLLTCISAVAGFVGVCNAQLCPLNFALRRLNVPSNFLATYDNLLDLCVKRGGNTYVAVEYANDPEIKYFEKGECYPYEINGHDAQMAVFCESVTCYNMLSPDCTGNPFPPLGVPLIPGLTLINALEIVGLVGEAALCW